MTFALRNNLENPQEEISALLAGLPPSVQDKVAKIKILIADMKPAGLHAFVKILRDEVDIIMAGENAYEIKIARILEGINSISIAANDENYDLKLNGLTTSIDGRSYNLKANGVPPAANDDSYPKAA